MAVPLRAQPKQAPHNIEAEMSVLGALLLDNRIIDALALRPEDFYRQDHAMLFQTIRDMVREVGETCDVVTLTDRLRMNGKLDQAGGYVYIATLAAETFSMSNVAAYAKVIREHAMLREVIKFGCDAAEAGYAQDGRSASEIIGELMLRIDGLHRGRASKVMTFADVAELAETAIADAAATRKAGRTLGAPTGLPCIDRRTGGLVAPRMWMIAGRPSLGKSALVNQIAVHAAPRGYPGYIASLEMDGAEIGTRARSHLSRQNFTRLLFGADAEREASMDAAAQMGTMPIYVDTRSEVIDDIVAQIVAAKNEHGIKWAAVDNIQLVQVARPARDRVQELSQISRTLKRLTTRLGIPIIVVSHINREVEKHRRKPVLSDLKDCLPGDAMVLDADSGRRVTVAEIASGVRPRVWALNNDLKFEKKPVTSVWSTGVQKILRVTTRTGRSVRCTTGHRFLSDDGWKRADELRVGHLLATPRAYAYPSNLSRDIDEKSGVLLGWILGDGCLTGGGASLTVVSREEAHMASLLAAECFGIKPKVKPEKSGSALAVSMTTGYRCGAGKNPMTSWLRRIGCWGVKGGDKKIPSCVFEAGPLVAASVLRGLFHADGSAPRRANNSVSIKFCSISERLARDVQHLLLRVGIISVLRKDTRRAGEKYKPSTEYIWTVSIHRRESVAAFLAKVGFLGAKHLSAVLNNATAAGGTAQHIDLLPKLANKIVSEVKRERGLSHSEVGWRSVDGRMSRASGEEVAARIGDDRLLKLATSDVTWDEVKEIVAEGYEQTFDLTVADLHNFCVDDVIAHNCGSLEQDADIVCALHSEDEDKVAEKSIKVGFLKNRTGRKGWCDERVVFHGSTQTFEEIAETVPDPGDE